MQVVLPSTPSRRNQEIYRIYHSHAKNQSELAKQYGISQQRVAQILNTVELWLGSCIPRENDLAPEERLYVAARNSRVNACEQQRWAWKIVEQSLQPQVTITQKLKNNELVQTEKRLKYGKCDQQMFQKIVNLTPQIEQAIQAEIAAEAVARRTHLVRPEHLEDLEVLVLLEACREIQRRVRRMRKAGIEMAPTPRFKRRQIEAYVRLQYRKNPDSYTFEDLLPPEWLEVRYKLYPDASGFRQWLAKEEKVEKVEMEVEAEVEVELEVKGDEGLEASEEEVESQPAEPSLAGAEVAPPEQPADEATASHSERPEVVSLEAETPPQELTFNNSAEVKKIAPKQQNKSAVSSAIPEDDESYTYTDVHCEPGYIRIRRTSKRTGVTDWFIPETYRENYDQYQKWLQPAKTTA